MDSFLKKIFFFFFFGLCFIVFWLKKNQLWRIWKRIFLKINLLLNAIIRKNNFRYFIFLLSSLCFEDYIVQMLLSSQAIHSWILNQYLYINFSDRNWWIQHVLTCKSHLSIELIKDQKFHEEFNVLKSLETFFGYIYASCSTKMWHKVNF